MRWQRYGWIVLFCICSVLVACGGSQVTSEKNAPHAGLHDRMPTKVILMIGDGMGLSVVSAAMNEQELQTLQEFPIIGLMRVNPEGRWITDSASSATAMAIGVKTLNGRIGVDAKGKAHPNLVKLSKKKGFSTGLVATSAITHATPAAFAAHVKDRNNFEAIAKSMMQSEVDLMIGGGRNHFVKRRDKKNLLKQMEFAGYNVFDNLEEAKSNPKLPLVCLTARKHLPSIKEGRGPYLAEATEIALQALNTDKDGFFLMVEGSQIDWSGHDGDMEQVLAEMADFDRAIRVALDFARQDPDVLVIVTADHETGGLTLTGDDLGKMKKYSFSTESHTAVMVPVYSYGAGASAFSGVYENTEIFHRIRAKLVLFD